MNDEDLQKLLISTKINSWTLRVSAAFFGIVCIFFVTFMIESSSRLSRIEATIVTSENIIKLKEEYHNKLGAFMTIQSYLQIESNKAIITIEYIDFVCSLIGIKEEELEKARTTAIRNLKSFSMAGTTRGRDEELSAKMY